MCIFSVCRSLRIVCGFPKPQTFQFKIFIAVNQLASWQSPMKKGHCPTFFYSLLLQFHLLRLVMNLLFPPKDFFSFLSNYHPFLQIMFHCRLSLVGQYIFHLLRGRGQITF
ncbi:hypothetical protein V6Z11_A01G101500 [Gossypium hirsutum]